VSKKRKPPRTGKSSGRATGHESSRPPFEISEIYSRGEFALARRYESLPIKDLGYEEYVDLFKTALAQALNRVPAVMVLEFSDGEFCHFAEIEKLDPDLEATRAAFMASRPSDAFVPIRSLSHLDALFQSISIRELFTSSLLDQVAKERAAAEEDTQTNDEAVQARAAAYIDAAINAADLALKDSRARLGRLAASTGTISFTAGAALDFPSPDFGIKLNLRRGSDDVFFPSPVHEVLFCSAHLLATLTPVTFTLSAPVPYSPGHKDEDWTLSVPFSPSPAQRPPWSGV